MSIWIKDSDPPRLAKHSYEKTLIASEISRQEAIVAWVDGSKFNFKVKHKCFGMVGGAINTNTGISFTKDELLYIANNMKDGAIFKIAACNSLYLSKMDDEFKNDNNMVQTGPNQFSPSEIAVKMPEYK